MTPAELVPSVLRSTHLTDSVARAQQAAWARQRTHAGLADLVVALFDDPDAASVWQGIDRSELLDALEVLGVRETERADRISELLAEAGEGSDGVVTAVDVLAAVVRGTSPVGALLRAAGILPAAVPAEPDISGFDLEEALSEEVPAEEVEEESVDGDQASPVPEPGEPADVPEDDFFEGVRELERAPVAPSAAPSLEASEPTGWFQVPVPDWESEPEPAPEPAPRPRKRGRAILNEATGQFEVPAAVRDGQVGHDIPEQMRVAVKVPVEARLVEGNPDGWTQGMDDPSIQEVLVTKAMSVRLVAPDGGFLIEGTSPVTQWIFGAPQPELQSGPAHWSWTVVPTERGKRRLHLVITARTVDEDGVVAETALPDQVVEVRVTANVARTALQVGGWAAATFVGGAIAAFGERIMRMIQDLTGM